jgi:putative Holliday junction resolvase
MKRGRRIAFDYGEIRIGVAICDPDAILSTPLPFLDARHPKLDSHIQELVDQYEPITIYVGEPRLLSGGSGIAMDKVKGFVTFLREFVDVPIIMVDERLSTVDAARKLREAGSNARESKNLIDSMAAVSILESGLARENK